MPLLNFFKENSLRFLLFFSIILVTFILFNFFLFYSISFLDFSAYDVAKLRGLIQNPFYNIFFAKPISFVFPSLDPVVKYPYPRDIFKIRGLNYAGKYKYGAYTVVLDVEEKKFNNDIYSYHFCKVVFGVGDKSKIIYDSSNNIPLFEVDFRLISERQIELSSIIPDDELNQFGKNYVKLKRNNFCYLSSGDFVFLDFYSNKDLSRKGEASILSNNEINLNNVFVLKR